MAIDIVLATWFANEQTQDLTGFASVRFVLEGTEIDTNPLVNKMLNGVNLPAGFLVSSDDLGGHAELLPPLGTRLELAIRPSTTQSPQDVKLPIV